MAFKAVPVRVTLNVFDVAPVAPTDAGTVMSVVSVEKMDHGALPPDTVRGIVVANPSEIATCDGETLKLSKAVCALTVTDNVVIAPEVVSVMMTCPGLTGPSAVTVT